MTNTLTFEKLHHYDIGKTGISIFISLKLKDVTVELEAKIDTGASYCIFSRGIGEDLGLNIEEGELIKIATVTGTFLAYGHNVTLCVMDYDFDALVYFAADERFSRNVLGRQGWLNQVKIALIDYEGKLYLSKYN